MNYVVVTDTEMIYINNVKEEFQFTITASKGNFKSYKFAINKLSFVEMKTEEDEKEFVYKTTTDKINLKTVGSNLEINIKNDFGSATFVCDSSDQFVRKGVDETIDTFFDALSEGIGFYHNV